jgi:hypothetical protein
MCYGADYNIGKEVQPRWERMNGYFRKNFSYNSRRIEILLQIYTI